MFYDDKGQRLTPIKKDKLLDIVRTNRKATGPTKEQLQSELIAVKAQNTELQSQLEEFRNGMNPTRKKWYQLKK